MADQFLPVLITLAVAVAFAIGLLAFSALMSQRPRQSSQKKGDTFESGVPLIDRAQKRISVKFYIVALVFVVLDVEVAFLYPWAVTYRDFLARNSTVVLWDMLAFISLLAVAYLYLWKKGVFDWGKQEPKRTGASESGL